MKNKKNNNDYENFDIKINFEINVKKLEKLFNMLLENPKVMKEGQNLIDKKRKELEEKKKKALE